MLRSSEIQCYLENDTSLCFPPLELPKGKTLLIKGNSGAGKTSFINSIAGLIPLVSGEIEIKDFGKIVQNKVPRGWRQNAITFVPQRPLFWPSLSVVDNLKLGQWSKGFSSENNFEVLEKLGILHVSKKPVNTLSYGQQQRLSVARALTSKAPLILADEPTSSLDEENKINVLKLFQEHQSETKCSMIISTHDSNINSIAHQIVNLK